jgi:SAM-dependent methyltransferase
MLWCPTCQTSGLHLRNEPDGDEPDACSLVCGSCKANYPIRFGHPILIPSDALTGSEWALWRAHLDKFQARREARAAHPEPTINRLALKSRPKRPFAAFTGIEEGTVLDVGCGNGNFRDNFDPERVQYFGLDPMALPDIGAFPFVQGLAECVPFKDDSFTDVVVLAAMDHFRDLDRFFEETRRVLRPGGRLHLLQSVHEVSGPISAIRVLAHKVKDSWEDRHTADLGRDVPKHLSEFTTRSLVERMSASFELLDSQRYAATWYSPIKLFLSFSPKENSRQRARAAAT